MQTGNRRNNRFCLNGCFSCLNGEKKHVLLLIILRIRMIALMIIRPALYPHRKKLAQELD